jgi:hypothetical protein
MTDEKIASHDEVLRLLTEKARNGSTGALIALERALRASAKAAQENPVDDAIERILTAS